MAFRLEGQLNDLVKRILFCPAEQRTANELRLMDRDDRELLWSDMTGAPEACRYRMDAESSKLTNLKNTMTNKLLSRSHLDSQVPIGAKTIKTQSKSNKTPSTNNKQQLKNNKP